MRDFGMIGCSFWEDKNIQRLDDLSVRIAAYLQTNRHMNCIGTIRLPMGYIIDDLQLENQIDQNSDQKSPKERVIQSLQRLEEVHFLNYDIITQWVNIPVFLQRNPISNVSHAKMAIKMFCLIPETVSFYVKLDYILDHINDRTKNMNGYTEICKLLHRCRHPSQQGCRHNGEWRIENNKKNPPFIPPLGGVDTPVERAVEQKKMVDHNLNTNSGGENVRKKTRGQNIAKTHWQSCATHSQSPTSDGSGLDAWEGD